MQIVSPWIGRYQAEVQRLERKPFTDPEQVEEAREARDWAVAATLLELITRDFSAYQLQFLADGIREHLEGESDEPM